MRYISHLDLVRLFSRTLRRAGIPIVLTQGFNPHAKISFERALRLGVESEGEKVIFYLGENLRASDFMKKMNGCLPCGIQIIKAYEE